MSNNNLDLMIIDSIRSKVSTARQEIPSLSVEPHFAYEEYTTHVIDVSGSMYRDDYSPSRFLAARDAVQWYMKARMSISPGELASLVIFNTRARVLFKSTPLSEALVGFHRSLSGIEPDGGTNITSGLNAAAQVLRSAPPHVRRRVVLLTDGGDFGSAVPVAESLKRDGVTIDVIGIGGEPACIEESYLRQIASVVNGVNRYRFIGDKDELLSHFASIATDIMCVR